jgi:PAT family beta-lactamase induction signal transducer AmpG
MWVAAALGFSSGLPLLLTAGPLQAWFREAGVSLETVGAMALVGLPYTFKFAWAPVFDRFSPPFLGRRRGWLLIAQCAVAGAILSLSASDPARSPGTAAALALAVAFFSASQDIVVDAHRREDLRESELGLGSALYVYGYRTGMLLSSAGGLVLADRFSFPVAYRLLALGMLLGVATTLFADEPPPPPGSHRPGFREAVLEPLREYFSRRDSIRILLFVVLYKLGDSMASWMATPFYLELGFTKTEIGTLANLFGYGAVLAGMFLGGAAILRLGLFRALWRFGILQAVSTLGFALLAVAGPSRSLLAGVIAFENLSGGMGTAAYMAFLASLTDKKFTATQYALLTSLMGIPRVLLSAPTGFFAARLGWTVFFVLCSAIALPGLALLRRFRPWLAAAQEESRSLAEVTRRDGGS